MGEVNSLEAAATSGATRSDSLVGPADPKATTSRNSPGKMKRAADGSYVQRPPLSRSASFSTLEGISFAGLNFSQQSEERKKAFKKGLRISACYDNASSFGGKSWTTTNAEIGSVLEPSMLKKKRAGLTSFELLRFLPHHPHWQDRPHKPGEPIYCPPSTYSDLGSYYRPKMAKNPETGEMEHVYPVGDPHAVYKKPPPRVELPENYVHSVRKVHYDNRKFAPTDTNMGLGGFTMPRNAQKTHNATAY